MYTVYKITNKLNEKYYIGVHKTDNPYDNYMGSGKAIKNAIEKYGVENFTKEILLVTQTKEEAYSLEKDLTSNYFEESNYNMKQGGVGGFTPENAHKGLVALCRIAGKASYEQKKGYHAQTDRKSVV